MKSKHLLPFVLLCFFSPTLLCAQWTDLGSGIDAAPRLIFSMHAIDENVIWAVTGFDYVDFTPAFEFTRTTDGGLTWQPGTLDIDSDLYHFDLFALDDQTAWLTTADEEDPISGKIYKTTDGGDTWEHQATAYTGFNETPAGVYFWNADEGVTFGATCAQNFNDQLAIYTTSDGGDIWTKVEGTNMPPQLPGEGICWWAGNSNYAVAGDTIWFFSSKRRMFRSVDRGLSWTVTGGILNAGYAVSVAFKDALNGIVVGRYPNRAARTTDGGATWTNLTFPLFPQAGDIEYVPGTAGTYLAHDANVTGSKTMLVTRNDGDSWQVVPESDENFSCLEFLSPTVGFAGGRVLSPEAGGIYRWDGDTFDESSGTRTLRPAVFELELFPVPATDRLNIRLPEAGAGLHQVQLFDSRGRWLREESLDGDLSISVYDLPVGLYQVRAVVGERVYAGRFVRP